MKSQAPCCSPHQDWLWPGCQAVVHRVIHRHCGRATGGAERRRVLHTRGRALPAEANARPFALDTAVGIPGCTAKGVANRFLSWRRRRADQIAGTASQAAPALALAHMPRVCPQGLPRWLWTPAPAGAAHRRDGCAGTCAQRRRTPGLPRWANRRHRVASRAGIGLAAHAKRLSTGSSTVAVDSRNTGCGGLMKSWASRCRPHQHWLWGTCPGFFHRVFHGGCGLGACRHSASALSHGLPIVHHGLLRASRIHPLAGAGAGVEWVMTRPGRMSAPPYPCMAQECGTVMKSQASRCRPRGLWVWATCPGVFHRVIHAGCGLCALPGRAGWRCSVQWTPGTGARMADEIVGTALQAAPVLVSAHMPSACPQGIPRCLWTRGAHARRSLRPWLGALVKLWAPYRKPRRHWLCAVSRGVVHRVIHGGCGRWRPAQRPGRRSASTTTLSAFDEARRLG